MASSLDASNVFLLDAGPEIYIWYSGKSSLMSRSKARLIAEKINKQERKMRATIIPVRAVSSIACTNTLYICMYVCMYVCMYIHVHIHTMYALPWLCSVPVYSIHTNISSRKNFVVFEVHRSSSKFLSLKASCCSQSPFSQLAASANFLMRIGHPPIFSYLKYL